MIQQNNQPAVMLLVVILFMNLAACLKADSCKDPVCLACPQDPYKCVTCSDGYYVSGGFCISCADKFCAVCTSSRCQQCKQGYYLTSGGTCLACHSKCTQCTSEGCKACQSGYELTNGLCFVSSNYSRKQNLAFLQKTGG